MDRVVIVIGFLVAVGMLAGCPADIESEDGIVLGAVFHDGISEAARLRLDGMRMAAEEINEADVLGAPLQVVNYSPALGDAADGDKAAANTRELYDERGAVGITSLFSGLGQAIIEVTNTDEYGDLVQCNCSASNPSLNDPQAEGSDRNDTFYRTVVTDLFQARLMVEVLQEHPWSQVGVYYLDDSFGQGLRSALLDELAALEQAEVTLDLSHPEGEFDLDANTEALDQIVMDSIVGEVDVVILATLKAQSPHIVRYLTEHGYAGGILLSDGAVTNDVFTVATDLAEWLGGDNVLMATEPDNYGGANSAQFVAAFQERYGVDSNTYSSTAYDCVFALALAMLYAGEDLPTAAGVKQGMSRFKVPNQTGDEERVTLGTEGFVDAAAVIEAGGAVVFDGASGQLAFDAEGDRPSQGMHTLVPDEDTNGWIVEHVYDEELNRIE